MNTVAPMTAGDPDAICRTIIGGDLRAAAKLISLIEARDANAAPLLPRLFSQGTGAPIIGITGPPGAGKSTLGDQLIAYWRDAGLRIAVLAVDPTSPVSGGALLGDRVRMGRHNTDRGVFIRSMAARGRLGGLAGAAGDALVVLGAMGFDRIIVETVGTGQNEIDILYHADTVMILQTPAGGDAVQAMKAGMLEIGDVFVVNKADIAGADRAVSALRDSIEFRHHGQSPNGWMPPVLKVQANSNSGISELAATLDAHVAHLAAFPDLQAKRRNVQARWILAERISEIVRFRQGSGRGGEHFERAVQDILARRQDPYNAARGLLDESGLL